MDIIRGLHNFRDYYAPCAATIGNFDGVHLGHQQMLAELTRAAADHQLPAVVLTFEPHPAEYFNNQPIQPRLTRLREKLLLLAQAQVNLTIVLPFNRQLAELSAEAFISEILIKKLNIRYLLVGADFQFGKQRQGNLALLQRAAEHYGFELKTMPTVMQQHQRISSTLIRQLLAAGDLTAAEALLGRPYHMVGRVVHGAKRGRLINFPTANIQIKRARSPISGVYAVEMLGVGPEPVKGVANVGSRPTVDGTRIIVEVHLFNFNQAIYGRQVQVNFLHKLRDEKRYDSFAELKAQIFKDAEAARQLLGLPRE